MNRTTQIPSTGNPVAETPGTFVFLRIRTATGPFQISFDSNTWVDAVQNDQFGPLKDANRVFFRTTNGVAQTVTYSYGKQPFTAQDTAQSNKPSSVQGNLGVAIGAGAQGGLPACDANGFLQVTNNMALKVYGTNSAGLRRQMLILSMSNQSPASLNVLDANGAAFMTINAGSPPVALPTDSDFTISGAGGTAWVTIGQIYLTSNN